MKRRNFLGMTAAGAAAGAASNCNRGVERCANEDADRLVDDPTERDLPNMLLDRGDLHVV